MQRAPQSLLRRLVDDARFYATIDWPSSRPTAIRLLRIALAHRGYWLLAQYRVLRHLASIRSRRSFGWWAARGAGAVLQCIGVICAKSEVRSDCDIPGPVYFAAGGRFILGAKRIGSGTVLQSGVTVGMTVANGAEGRPVIGANVWIGGGSVIAGDLNLGDGSTVMPDSLVTTSVPAGAVARGNPARVVRPSFDNSEGRRLARTVSVPPGFDA